MSESVYLIREQGSVSPSCLALGADRAMKVSNDSPRMTSPLARFFELCEIVGLVCFCHNLLDQFFVAT